MSPTEPTVNSMSTASLTVSPSDLASALPLESIDSFPAVFATSRLVALMEIAGARALHPILQQGQLSVGVSVDITHTAPTPVGSMVVAEATYVSREENLYVFDIVAKDEGGVVGRAKHKRAIVDAERLEKRARTRTGGKDAWGNAKRLA